MMPSGFHCRHPVTQLTADWAPASWRHLWPAYEHTESCHKSWRWGRTLLSWSGELQPMDGPVERKSQRLAWEHDWGSDLILSTEGAIVSGVCGCWALTPMAGLIPSYGKISGDGVERAQRLPQLSAIPTERRQALGRHVCSGLIHEIQMGDVTGPRASCHLVTGFVSDAGQFEAQQMVHHVIA